MQRTQIYLSAEQVRKLDALAIDSKRTRAAVIRELLDLALKGGAGVDDRVMAVEQTAGACPDGPGWQEVLNTVRGNSTAAVRMEELWRAGSSIQAS